MPNIKSIIWRLKKIYYNLKDTKLWLVCAYAIGIVYDAIYSTNSIHKTDQTRPIRKVLIIYSKAHFDPENDSPNRTFAYTSAGNIARNLYESFKGKYEVVYKDQGERIENINDADLIIGLACSAFIQYSKQNPQAKKYVFLVNSHPLFQMMTLLKNSKVIFKIHRYEYGNIFTVNQCLKISDKAIAIGNNYVKDSYGKHSNKIVLINSGVNFDILKEDHSKLDQNKINILFCATNLGLRKGIFRLIEVWEELTKKMPNSNLSLTLVGHNVSYTEVVNKFIKDHNNISLAGWVDSTSERYRSILQSAHIILGLSLEEGQVGSILESMCTGAVPVMTVACGINIDHTKEGFIINKYSKEEVVKDLEKLISNKNKLLEMRKDVIAYTHKNHSWNDFQENIRKITLS